MKHSPPWSAALAVCLLALPAAAEEPPPKEDPARVPATRVDEEGNVHVGNVVISKDRTTIRIPGHVNMDRDQVELLACGEQGKTHESVFVLDADALHLHAAMLLVGIQPAEGPKAFGEWEPRGLELEVFVEWTEDGKTRREPSGRMVRDPQTRKSPERFPWIFTGSAIRDGRYVATQEQSYFATWWDPFAVFNIGLPEGADDTNFDANPDVVPEVGTVVVLEIRLPARPAP